jgi:hypothetical protein
MEFTQDKKNCTQNAYKKAREDTAFKAELVVNPVKELKLIIKN